MATLSRNCAPAGNDDDHDDHDDHHDHDHVDFVDRAGSAPVQRQPRRRPRVGRRPPPS